MSKNLIAVNKDIEGTGAIVWWKVSGTTNVAALNAAWGERVDLDPDLLMKVPTPGAALRRALASHVHAAPGGGRYLCSSLGEENAYALVHETADGVDTHHTQLLKVRLGARGDVESDQLTMTVLDGCPVGLPIQIKQDYTANRETFSGSDISSWFANVLLPAFAAVSLRDQGGMWFVPRTHLTLWSQACEALRQVSLHQMFRVRALSTDPEDIAGILDAVASEAAEAAQRMEDKLLNDDLGVRALRSQAAKLDGVISKVQGYESMLDTNLTTIRSRLGVLNAQLAAAILTAEAKINTDSPGAV